MNNIKKYKLFKESLLNKLNGPSEEEIIEYLKPLNIQNKLSKSAEIGYLNGIITSLNNGADINYNNSITLYLSVNNSHYDIVKYLIEHGADIKGNNNDIIKSAILSHDPNILKILLDNSKHKFDIDELILLAIGLNESEIYNVLINYKNKIKRND